MKGGGPEGGGRGSSSVRRWRIRSALYGRVPRGRPLPLPPISAWTVHSSALADRRIPNDTGALPGRPAAHRSLVTGRARAAVRSRPSPMNRDLQVWATRDVGHGAAAYAVALAGRRLSPPMARLPRSAWRVADQAPVGSSPGSRMS